MKTRLDVGKMRAPLALTRRAILSTLLSLSFLVPHTAAVSISPIEVGGPGYGVAPPAAPAAATVGPGVCLNGVDVAEGLGVLPGRLSEAVSLYSSRNRTNSLDNETTLAVIALARSLGEPLRFDEITTFHEERMDVCIFDRLSTFEAESVLGALTLGLRAPADALRALVPDSHIIARFESVIDQRVELDTTLALQALAFHGAGGDVRLADVLTIHQSARTERTFEARTSLDKADALLAEALRAPGRA